jgi:hypothetical protein
MPTWCGRLDSSGKLPGIHEIPQLQPATTLLMPEANETDVASRYHVLLGWNS